LKHQPGNIIAKFRVNTILGACEGVRLSLWCFFQRHVSMSQESSAHVLMIVKAVVSHHLILFVLCSVWLAVDLPSIW